MQFHYKIQWLFLRLIVRSYFRLSTQGCEHIPPSGPVLLAANHCSYLDPPLIALGLPRQITFLAKEELFSIPVFNHWLRWNGAFPVARGQGDMKALRQALRLLDQGKALLVFPEGTRSPNGMLQPLESGIAWLALKTGAPIVPLYLSGTYRAYPRGAWLPHPTRLGLRVGPLLQPEKMGQESNREAIGFLMNRLDQAMQAMQQQALAEKPRKEKKSPSESLNIT